MLEVLSTFWTLTIELLTLIFLLIFVVWKYDGKTISNLEIKSEMEYVLLICIYQDNNGTIWLGTDNDGVYKQNGDKLKKFKLKK